MSALLHALASLCPPDFNGSQQSQGLSDDDDNATEPVTSYLCKWNVPRKRKESNKTIAESVFEKHVYGRQRKHSIKPLEDFNPQPESFRKTANDNLTVFLGKVRGLGLGVSVLKDKECICWSSRDLSSSLEPILPTKDELQERVKEFKKSLAMPSEKLREIEQSTRDQSHNPLWYSVRQYRLTASYFGAVYHRQPTTPPHCLVLQILGSKRFTSAATEWGKRKEHVATRKYSEIKNSSGHNFYCCSSGFVISEKYPFLGASPDSVVFDSSEPNPFGLAEVKCPYTYRNQTPFEAASSGRFFCEIDEQNTVRLKRNHTYYCQVQGQMAITERKWCDFIVYTEKGITIERIKFDLEFWTNSLLPKLEKFYDNCLCPEIVSPVHVLGKTVRNLEDM